MLANNARKLNSECVTPAAAVVHRRLKSLCNCGFVFSCLIGQFPGNDLVWLDVTVRSRDR